MYVECENKCSDNTECMQCLVDRDEFRSNCPCEENCRDGCPCPKFDCSLLDKTPNGTIFVLYLNDDFNVDRVPVSLDVTGW